MPSAIAIPGSYSLSRSLILANVALTIVAAVCKAPKAETTAPAAIVSGPNAAAIPLPPAMADVAAPPPPTTPLAAGATDDEAACPTTLAAVVIGGVFGSVIGFVELLPGGVIELGGLIDGDDPGEAGDDGDAGEDGLAGGLGVDWSGGF